MNIFYPFPVFFPYLFLTQKGGEGKDRVLPLLSLLCFLLGFAVLRPSCKLFPMAEGHWYWFSLTISFCGRLTFLDLTSKKPEVESNPAKKLSFF